MSAAALATAKAALREARALCREADARVAAAEATLATGLESGLQGGVKTGFQPDDPPTDHRREHRPGTPSKIDTDPELRAFILARIEHLTFVQLEAAIADSFPEGRRVRRTAINDWLNKNRPRHTPPLPSSSQPE